MATYVNDLRLKEIATGDESGTWGTSTNTNLELIGESMGYGTEAVADASTHTITMADGATDGFRCTFLRLTGGGQACTVTLAPNTLSHTWIIRNTTSYALTFTQGSGANVIIAAGLAKMVTTDGLGSGAVVYECLEDLELGGTLTVGIDDTGQDVKFYGATSGKSLLWDESADSLIVTGSTSQQGTLTVGVDDTGYDVKLFGATSGKYWLWDESADGVVQQGTLTVGVDDTGFDVKLFGATSGNYMLWDESADSLLVNGDIDMVTNGNRIDLDTDNDTSIRASADDTITVEVGGSDLIALTTTSTFSCPVTVGVDDTGHDVKLFGATSGKSLLWDESADSLIVTGATSQQGTLTVGVDDTGYDVKLFGATSGAYMLWDESADDLKLVGAAGLTVAGDIDVDGTTNLDAVDIDGAVQIDSTVTVGADDTGYDVKFFAATASKYMLWDESADSLIVQGDFYIGATAVQGAGGCTFDLESRHVNQTFNESSHVNNTEWITFRNAGTQIGSIIADSSSSTSYATSSDYRLKENVDYSWDATTRLKQLKPARFNWIADSSNTLQDGFLAHEVSSIVPESVCGDKDATETYTDDNGDEQTRIKPQQIDLSKLVPLLVKTIQELEARIAVLEA